MKNRSSASRFAVCIALMFWAATANAGWRSTLSEDFNGTSLNGSIWSPNLDTNNDQSLPNNGELECYIPGALGVANGTLTVTAQNQQTQCTHPSAVYSYSSGAIASYNRFSQQYGYFEVRAQLPPGQGMWPAFWMLPNPSGWPPEIDIMEEPGSPQFFTTTYHWVDGTFGHTAVGTRIDKVDLSAGYHTYGVDWQPGRLVFYFDGAEVFRVPLTAGMGPQQPMFMLANLAVGGYGIPDPSGDSFPQQMLIDYIHVYTRDPSVQGDDTLPPGASAPSVPNVPLDIRAIDFSTKDVDDGTTHAPEGQYSGAYNGNAWLLTGPAFIAQSLNFPTTTTYQFTIEAASDSGATLSVDIDGQSVVTTAVSSGSLNNPYVLDAAVSAGAHDVSIRMVDPTSGQDLTLGSINIRDPSVPLPSPNGTPSVALYSPQDGSDLTPDSWTTISGAASGGTGIEKVQYFIDGNLFCTALSAPYNCPYDPTVQGTHTLTARAIDTSGTSQDATATYQVGTGGGGSSTVTVAIWAPSDGQVFQPNSFTTLTAVASSNNTLATFDFYVDGSHICANVPAADPTNCSYQTPASGSHTVTVVATDSTGATGQQTATFSISQSSSVSVTIWAPSNGQTFAANSFTTLTAIAGGNNPISRFDFNVDGSPVCSNVPPSSPTNCSYQVPASGTHTVQVVATDSTGATGQSSAQFSVQ